MRISAFGSRTNAIKTFEQGCKTTVLSAKEGGHKALVESPTVSLPTQVSSLTALLNSPSLALIEGRRNLIDSLKRIAGSSKKN